MTIKTNTSISHEQMKNKKNSVPLSVSSVVLGVTQDDAEMHGGYTENHRVL